jgi:hypothetical protein
MSDKKNIHDHSSPILNLILKNLYYFFSRSVVVSQFSSRIFICAPQLIILRHSFLLKRIYLYAAARDETALG